MAISQRQARVVAQIRKRFGAVIDLQKSPSVLIEIIRNFGRVLDDDGTGGGGPGGTSTVAVGIDDGGTNTGGTGSGGTGSGGTNGGTGSGGTGGGTSTVAVGITPPESGFQRARIEEVLRVVLKLQKQIDTMGKQLAGKALAGRKAGR